MTWGVMGSLHTRNTTVLVANSQALPKQKFVVIVVQMKKKNFDNFNPFSVVIDFSDKRTVFPFHVILFIFSALKTWIKKEV